MVRVSKAVKQRQAIIGRVEPITLVDFNTRPIPAKVDTGADLSSIWASKIREHNDHLHFTLFDETSRYYTGERIKIDRKAYRLTRVANSFGDRELRYVVKLRIKLDGRTINASFTLANRGLKTYPILLGRRLLKNKFLVDVSKGKPLYKQETAKHEKLKADLKHGKL